MSRAFVKESDGEDPAEQLPDPPDDGAPNWITPEGLAALEERLRRLSAERRELGDGVDERPRALALDRTLRVLRRRLGAARVVDPRQQPGDRVAFGAEVDVLTEDDARETYRIVGEDEADIAAGKVSWRSPLAQALYGAAVGDEVVWQRPAGDRPLEVAAIRYPGRDAAPGGDAPGPG